jgi:hypothetical protein
MARLRETSNQAQPRLQATSRDDGNLAFDDPFSRGSCDLLLPLLGSACGNLTKTCG